MTLSLTTERVALTATIDFTGLFTGLSRTSTGMGRLATRMGRYVLACYAWVLAVMFGDTAVDTLGVACITPMDDILPSRVYEVQYQGFREVRWIEGRQATNLLAYGYTLAFTA